MDFEARGAVAYLIESLWDESKRHAEVLIEGPAGCVAGETELWDPVAGRGRRIDELCRRGVRPWVQTLIGPVLADVPFLKGYAPLYRVTLEDGSSCLATADHLFGSSRGWVRTDSLVPGRDALLARGAGGRHSTRIAPGSPGDCPSDRRCGDARPRGETGTGPEGAPSRCDAPGPDRDGLRADALASRRVDSRSYPWSDRRATSIRSGHAARMESVLVRGGGCSSTPCAESFLAPERSPMPRLQRVRAPLDDGGSGRTLRAFLPGRRPLLVSGQEALDARRSLYPEQRASRAVGDPRQRGSGPAVLGLCASRLCGTSWQSTVRWSRVQSVVYERTDLFYDLHVPVAEHYLADGIYSHNTGKSRGVCEFINACCEEWPGIRVLLCRQTRKSLTESVLVTLWERDTLGPNHPAIRSSRATAGHREAYDYPPAYNAFTGQVGSSHVVLVGLEDVDRHLSTEWDLIVVVECTECSLDTWEKLITRTERVDGAMPWGTVIGDCNPAMPIHWANVRAESGLMKRLLSRHIDHPALYDREGNLTERGAKYMATLDRLTGGRRARLRDGLWVAQTGQILDEYDAAIHVVSGRLERLEGDRIRHALHVEHSDGRTERVEIHWTMAAIDWGYSPDPGTLQVWGFSGDKRAFLLAEIYQLRRQVEWWAARAEELYKEFKMSVIVADPSRPADLKALNDRLGPLRTRGAPSLCVKAENAWEAGVDMLRWCLLDPEDGRVRLHIWDGALRDGVDVELTEAGKAGCLAQEIPSYVFRLTKDGRTLEEQDPRCANHGIDAARYAMMWAWARDLTPPEPDPVEYGPGTYGYTSKKIREWERKGGRGRLVV